MLYSKAVGHTGVLELHQEKEQLKRKEKSKEEWISFFAAPILKGIEQMPTFGTPVAYFYGISRTGFW